jgi:hypothetical protein
MRDAVLLLGLSGGHLVVSGEFQLVAFEIEDRIGPPDVRIGRAATRPAAAAPFVGEHDFLTVVGEGSRVPVRVVWVVHRIDSLRIHRVFDVQQHAPAARPIAEYTVMSWH